jgi:hypothetical protein
MSPLATILIQRTARFRLRGGTPRIDVPADSSLLYSPLQVSALTHLIERHPPIVGVERNPAHRRAFKTDFRRRNL